jgi:hypothetical protein
MWMNSPLGKWEQETRVEKALRDAARMRTQEAAGDGGGTAWRARLLNAARLRCARLPMRTRGAIEGVQTSLASRAAHQD